MSLSGLNNGIRRYLVWIGYDGSKFSEMAKGGTGMGTMDLFGEVISHSLYGRRSVDNPFAHCMKFSPSSRTDAGVHAIRSSVILQVPLEKGILDDTQDKKQGILKKWNELSHIANPYALEFKDFHIVSAGFCIRRSVQYRRYTYRLAVRKPFAEEALVEQPSMACFSEKNYAWILPSNFDPYRAQKACDLFKGVHCMASFFKHSARDKRTELIQPDTMKNLLHVGISRGEHFAILNDMYDYYDLTVVSKSFLREQIRRMVICVVRHAQGKMSLDQIRWLLRNPDSRHFSVRHIPIAPPSGLFLTDVVYNRNHFSHPNPYFYHSWDYDL